MHINSDFIHMPKLNKNLLSSPITTQTETTLTDNINNYDIIYVVTDGNTYSNCRYVNTYLCNDSLMNTYFSLGILYSFYGETHGDMFKMWDNTISTTVTQHIGTPDSSSKFRIVAVWGIKF